MNKIKEYALAVMAFLENLAQAITVFFRKRITPAFKPLKTAFLPVGKRLKKFFVPVFKFLKARPIITVMLIGILYFVGIAAVIYPLIGNIYTLRHSIVAIEQYDTAIERMSDEEIEQKFKNAEIYNTDLANGIYNDGYERSLNSVNELVCFVEVPSVDIYLPVYYGVTEYNLQRGCAWIENTSLPVPGKSVHSVISGHTGLPNAEMFTKLDRVKLGEVFYVHVLNKVFAYKVENIVAVTPDKTYLLNVFPDKDYCTLLTCTPYGINSHRLLVRGERIPYTVSQNERANPKSTKSSVNDIDEELQNEIDHQITIIIGIVAVSVIVYIFACVWLFKTVRKKSVDDDILDLTEDDMRDNNGEEIET